MDVLEIMTVLRNVKGVDIDVPDKELLRFINLGYRYIVAQLEDKVGPYLVQDDYSKTITGQDFYYPDDFNEPVSMVSDGKLCSRITADEKELVGNNVNYPSDANNPLVLFKKGKAEIFPSVTSKTVKMTYLAMPPDLMFGESSIDSSGKMILGYSNERASDGYYTNTRLAFYTKPEASFTLQGEDIITAYTGATFTVTLKTFTSLSNIIYASIPVIPPEYHTLIAEAALLEMAKAYPGKMDEKSISISASVLNRMIAEEKTEKGN